MDYSRILTVISLLFIKTIILIEFKKIDKIEVQIKNTTNNLWVVFSDDLKSGDFVDLYWDGITIASIYDEIRIFCPLNLEDNKILRIYTHKEYPDIGNSSGKISVRVFYERSMCEFRYFSAVGNNLTKYATSNPVIFKNNISDALQIHLAFTQNQSQMRVSWVSGLNHKPCLIFGKSKDNLNQKACGETTTYSSYDMCEPIATTLGYIDPGFLHNVVLKNLESDTIYFYKIQDNLFEKIFTFRSSVFTENFKTRKISFAVFGDMDVTPFPAAYGTVESLLVEISKSSSLDFAVHVGDISYAMGVGYIWTEFGTMIESVASKIPYMIVVGNHEHNHFLKHEKYLNNDGENFRPQKLTYLNDSGGECAIPLFHRYPMPENGNSIFWYSFNYGNVHSISISSENNFTIGSLQYNWLQNDLKNVDRKQTPWIVIYIHRSIYISAPFLIYDNASTLIKNHLEPLLLEYNVNFVISGHYHSYERTCPVKMNKCVDMPVKKSNWGIVHLTVGTAGRKLSDPISEYNEWSKATLFEYGIGRLDILNQNYARFVFIKNENHQILDSFDYSFDLDE